MIMNCCVIYPCHGVTVRQVPVIIQFWHDTVTVLHRDKKYIEDFLR